MATSKKVIDSMFSRYGFEYESETAINNVLGLAIRSFRPEKNDFKVKFLCNPDITVGGINSFFIVLHPDLDNHRAIMAIDAPETFVHMCIVDVHHETLTANKKLLLVNNKLNMVANDMTLSDYYRSMKVDDFNNTNVNGYKVLRHYRVFAKKNDMGFSVPMLQPLFLFGKKAYKLNDKVVFGHKNYTEAFESARGIIASSEVITHKLECEPFYGGPILIVFSTKHNVFLTVSGKPDHTFGRVIYPDEVIENNRRTFYISKHNMIEDLMLNLCEDFRLVGYVSLQNQTEVQFETIENFYDEEDLLKIKDILFSKKKKEEKKSKKKGEEFRASNDTESDSTDIKTSWENDED